VLAGRRLLAAAAACGLLLLAAACGERSEPVGAPAELYPVTITSQGEQPLVIRQPAHRIALLDPGARAMLQALGAGKEVVGVPVSDSGRPRPAELRRLQPDLVVAPSGTEPRTLSEAASSGATVYVVPDSSITEVERAVTQLGLLTAHPAAARHLVATIEQARARVSRALRGVPRVKTFVDLGFFTTASDQTLIGDLVREAHGVNVAGTTAEAGPFDLAELRAANPQVYIATTDGGTTLKDLKKNRATKKLAAVRKGRVVVVDSRLLEPGPDLGRGLLELARALHPDAFR
jgi:iron complex transport system substrate-binding protein